MLASLKLLLPALTPSWRFFDSVGPSPRIEYALAKGPQEDADNWREFRPRPAVLPFREMLKRLFWNPAGNERLFLTSCAERLLENPTEHSRREIGARIAAELSQSPDDARPCLQFRIVLVSRDGARFRREVAYASPVQPYREKAPA